MKLIPYLLIFMSIAFVSTTGYFKISADAMYEKAIQSQNQRRKAEQDKRQAGIIIPNAPASNNFYIQPEDAKKPLWTMVFNISVPISLVMLIAGVYLAIPKRKKNLSEAETDPLA